MSADQLRRLLDRFWSKVDKQGPLIPHMSSVCWIWTRSTNNWGYGKFGLANGSGTKFVSAHRFSYELSNGPITSEGVIAHECDNTRCIRPDHLVLKSQKENVADMHMRSRHRYGVNAPNHKRLKTAAIRTDG